MLLKRIAAFLLALLLIFNPMCMRPAYAADMPATPTDIYEEIIEEQFYEFEDDDWGKIDPDMFERKVYIEMAEQSYSYGDEVTLIAILVDFKPEDNPTFEWQHSFDCENWEIIENEHGQRLSFVLTPDNAGWYYRVLVTI